MTDEPAKDKDYFCRDLGFAAYLSCRNELFIFLGAIDTGEPLPRGNDTIKEFQFIVNGSVDMNREYSEYVSGSSTTKVRAVVLFNKIRLMRQACQSPISRKQLEAA